MARWPILFVFAAACGPDIVDPIFEAPAPDPQEQVGVVFDPGAGTTPDVTPNLDIPCCYVHLEAEHFDGWSEQANLFTFYGRGFVTSGVRGRPAGQTHRMAVTLSAGTYEVWARAYRDETDRSLSIQIGDVRLSPTHFPSSEHGFLWARTGTVVVANGDHKVTIHDEGDGFEALDAVVLSSSPGLDPLREEQRFRLFPTNVTDTMIVDELALRAARYRDAIPTPTTAEEALDRADHVRLQLARALGLEQPPERSALDARVARVIERDGYSIEVVAFESRPGFIVTANVYVPNGPGPFPVVVSPIGHGLEKRSHLAAARNHRLAQLGYITIVYDPFGQGERNITGMDHSENWRLGLTGRSNMTIMVWDSIRALDYMLTRRDVDPTRIAVTGYSGGGLNTLYFAALDERLDVAMPASYVTSFEAFIATRITHDACTYAPTVGGFTDMGEIVATFAPKPYLVLTGVYDESFPVDGATTAADIARVRYDLLEAPGAFDHAVFDVGHTYDRQMRERMYGFVSRALLDKDGTPIDEGRLDLLAENDPDLNFHNTGRVPWGSTNVSRLSRDWAIDAIAGLQRTEVDRDAVHRRIGPTEGADFDVVRYGPRLTAQGFDVEALAFDAGDGVMLPAFLYVHDDDGPLVVITDGAGLMSGAPLAEARRAGVSALYVSMRGRGEAWVWDGWLTANNQLLDDPLAAQRAFDLERIRRALYTMRETAERPVALLALDSESAVEALYVQALFGSYEAAVIGPTQSSLLDSFTQTPPWSSFVFGILEVADVPQLVLLASERPLRIEFSTRTWLSFHGALAPRIAGRVNLEPTTGLGDAIEWAVSAIR